MSDALLEEGTVERLVVACVQQRMHLPQSLSEYIEHLRRFMKVATAKQARLVIFPELGGVMVAPPLLWDFHSTLLKRADRGERKRAGLWERIGGMLAKQVAHYVQADFRRSMHGLLDSNGALLWQAYQEAFSQLAREYHCTVVAPSAYLPDPIDGVVRNLSVVFNEKGEMVGSQAKVVLHPEDQDIAQPGTGWDVIGTDVGQIGLILGSDVLYPEVGRLLAYQGADILVVAGACTEPVLYQKLRAGTLARMQDNQLFAAASFLIGANRFSRREREPFVGKSAIFAPQELTPKQNGVLVEMGSAHAEGVVTAEWDFGALRMLWEESDTPLRRQLPMAETGPILAKLYSQLQRLPAIESQTGAAAARTLTKGKKRPVDSVGLDALPVVSSTTSRWPLLPVAEQSLEAESLEWHESDEGSPNDLAHALRNAREPDRQDTNGERVAKPEDETDEMDALPPNPPGAA
jgi:predicted amidohydrolase